MKCPLSIFLFTLLMCFVSHSAFAQSNDKYEDVLLLKSAEVLRGEITDMVPGQSITILLNDGTSRTVSFDEVAKILKERKRPQRALTKAEHKDKQRASANTWGYRGRLSAGYGFNPKDNELNYLRVNFLHGMGIGQNLAISVGSGVRVATGTDNLAVPLLGDFRVSVPGTTVSPTFAMGAGILFQESGPLQKNSSLFYFEGGIVIGDPASKPSVMLSLGFESFNFHEQSDQGPSLFMLRNTYQERAVSSFHLNLAFTF